MKCLVHSEWPHQVVKSNLQLIFHFSSLLWNQIKLYLSCGIQV
jgi:hypothetical protein